LLNDDELRSLWRAAVRAGAYGALIMLLLLTAQRRSAVVGMRWADLDGDVWHIPAEPGAKSTGGDLRLPEMALSIIRSQPRFVGCPYVLSRGGRGPLSGFSTEKASIDKSSGVTDWVVHDLRRCARSLMSRAGVSREHSERVLGHTISGVEGTYDRHPYFAEKADALRRLADLIEQIINGAPGGNVVPMRSQAGAVS
jgi:integrase